MIASINDIFDKYDDEGFTCYHLRDAEMKIGKDY